MQQKVGNAFRRDLLTDTNGARNGAKWGRMLSRYQLVPARPVTDLTLVGGSAQVCGGHGEHKRPLRRVGGRPPAGPETEGASGPDALARFARLALEAKRGVESNEAL